jgi:microcystin-dependent protein
MAQSETGFQVENSLFPLVRRRLNEILLALATSNFGAGNPPVMLPYMFQVIEQGGKLVARVRNAANDGWEYNLFGGSSAPPGSGLDYFGTTLPDGWLWRDGAKYQRADYPNLFAAIGTTYNQPSDTAFEFRVPDDRQRVTVGAGTSFPLASTGGQQAIAINKVHLPNYTLPSSQSGHAHQVTVGSTDPSNLGGNNLGLLFRTDLKNTSDINVVGANNANISVSLDGGTVSNNIRTQTQFPVMQPYFVCNKIIKV